MKAEELVVLASAGVIAGSVVEQNVAIPVVSTNKWYGVGLGAVVALLGFFVVKMDGVGDFVEAFGIGYGAAAALS
jgi:NCAIR mutase (PurE)-related protein